MIKVPLYRFQMSLGPFAMFFLKSPIKQDFTEIFLITFFGDGNLGNTSAMRVIFFLKTSKFNVDFKNAEKKLRKSLFFLR